MSTKRSRILVRLPEKLHTLIKRRAKRRLRSMNSEAIVMLKLGLACEKEETDALPAADELLENVEAERAANDSE